jgi:hypothetical protein
MVLFRAIIWFILSLISAFLAMRPPLAESCCPSEASKALEAVVKCLGRNKYLRGLDIDCPDSFLHRINLRLVEINLAALLTYESGHTVEHEMISLAINVKRSGAAFHFPFAIHTFHNQSMLLDGDEKRIWDVFVEGREDRSI